MFVDGLAHMSHAPFNQAHGLAMPASGLASRRGGQTIKPLSFDTSKSQEIDNGAPTPRTSRSHLLAGLRTAPKTATAATFSHGPASPTTFAPPNRNNRNSMGPGYDTSYGGPKTSMPRFEQRKQTQAQAIQEVYQQQVSQMAPQQQAQAYGNNMGAVYGQQYTAEQILAPPQLQIDEAVQDQIDPDLQAQLMYANAYLSNQQQRLQNQVRLLQAAASQFQGLNLNNQMQMMQQSYPGMYQQQQAMMSPVTQQQNIYASYDPATGQQTLYMDQQAQQAQLQQLQQAQLQAQIQAQLNPQYGHQAQQYMNQMAGMANPRVQVSPPPAENRGFRNPSPPRRFESPIENPTPLPPPSANAFRRCHKKSSSTANGGKGLVLSTDDVPKNAGPKTASFPLTPMTAGYGPGQARAGEHPTRQPRNPPSMDELKTKPTAKHEGSKNFITRTRRSAISNLVRLGMERRKDTRSSGNTSPVSETIPESIPEETVETPLTDNDSDSGRSGSGSLVENDDAECSLPSSRSSTGSWGAIGSNRPSSRQKIEQTDSTNSSDNEGARNFASLLKTSSRAAKVMSADGQRKAPMLVLTSAEKRKVIAV